MQHLFYMHIVELQIHLPFVS